MGSPGLPPAPGGDSVLFIDWVSSPRSPDQAALIDSLQVLLTLLSDNDTAAALRAAGCPHAEAQGLVKQKIQLMRLALCLACVRNGVTDPRLVLQLAQRLGKSDYPTQGREASVYVMVRNLRTRLFAAELWTDDSGHLRACMVKRPPVPWPVPERGTWRLRADTFGGRRRAASCPAAASGARSSGLQSRRFHAVCPPRRASEEVRIEIRDESLDAFSDIAFRFVDPKVFFEEIITPALAEALDLRASIGPVRVTFTPPSPSCHEPASPSQPPLPSLAGVQ